MRIALFTGLLAIVFVAALLAGRAIDPDVGESAEQASHGESAPHGEPSLDLVNVPERAGATEPLAFRVADQSGEVVTGFDVAHDRRMHAIVVRRDLTGFRHLHPEMDEDGTWRTTVELDAAGEHRLFADFETDGRKHVLTADVDVPGTFEPRPLPPVSARAGAGDGYEVRLAERAGDELRFTVFADGRRVTDLEPYLGARGHLVALREADLEYLHVHPESAATRGGDIRFRVEYPSAARYRLFLQFRHEGEVRTAAFTRDMTSREAAGGGEPAAGDEHGGDHGH